MYRRTILMAVQAITVLAVPAGAFAASGNPSSDPTAAQYGSAADGAQSVGGSGLHGKVGELPFTGWDVAALLIVSAAMVLTGMTVRRLSRPTN